MSQRPKSSPAKALHQRSSTKSLQQIKQAKVEQRCGSAASMRRAEANKHSKSLSSSRTSTSTSIGNTSVKTKGKEVRKVASRRNCKARNPDTNSTMYKAYGSTTETRPDNPEPQADPLDPYDEMLKKAQESIKEKMELLNFQAAAEGGRDTTLKENQSQEGRKATEEPKDTIKESKDITGKAEEDQEEDDDDDEQGMPQAVRPLEPQGDPDTELGLIKALHLATMEETAKTVKPKKMLKHFRESGYFNWDYQEHCRATNDNHNLKNGLKKGLERLYAVMALQGPSSHCTLSAK